MSRVDGARGGWPVGEARATARRNRRDQRWSWSNGKQLGTERCPGLTCSCLVSPWLLAGGYPGCSCGVREQGTGWRRDLGCTPQDLVRVWL